jgi:hypothetical protein
MRINSQLLKLALWVIPLLLQPLIALTLIFRKQVKTFTLFFSYTLCVPGRDLLLLFLRHNARAYAWIYFIGELVSIVLGLAVIYEVLWHLIRPYHMLRILGIRLFWLSSAMVAATAVVMLGRSDFGRSPAWIDSILLVERSARFLQVGVLIAFILFISRFGLTWKDYTPGIVVGFGIAAGLQLGLFELKSLHAIPDSIFVVSTSAAYNCAVLVWAAYFVPRRVQSASPTRLQATDLARWDELLREYLNR